MVAHWAPFLLERYVAAKSSALTRCLAPEVPEPTNYFGSFFLTTFSHRTTARMAHSHKYFPPKVHQRRARLSEWPRRDVGVHSRTFGLKSRWYVVT